MIKLLLTIFLVLSLANQFTPVHAEPETAPAFACVPGQANQDPCFSNELNDDQRLIRVLAVNFVALPFAPKPSFAGCCPNRRPIEFLSCRRPLYNLNAVLLI
jgi:hypothetical protein